MYIYLHTIIHLQYKIHWYRMRGVDGKLFRRRVYCTFFTSAGREASFFSYSIFIYFTILPDESWCLGSACFLPMQQITPKMLPKMQLSRAQFRTLIEQYCAQD